MFESLERVRRELEARIVEIDEALNGYERLIEERAALVRTLAGPPFSGDDPRVSSRRAARGENLKRVLELIADRPGVTVSEISDATGISKPVVHNTVRALLAASRVERDLSPAGINAYRPVRQDVG